MRVPDFPFRKPYRTIWLLCWFFPESIRKIVQEELTDALHPEFGWYHLEQAEKAEKAEKARKS